MAQKTIYSAWNKRSVPITRSQTRDIIRKISNSSVRSDLINKVKHFKYGGSGGTSTLKKITEEISKTAHGSLAVHKFLGEFINRDNEKKTGPKKTGPSPEQKEKNINRIRRQRMEEEDKNMGKVNYINQFGGGSVESHGIRGTMKDLNVSWNKRVGDKTGGFASQYQDKKLPNNLAPKMPSIGARPIGL